MDGALFFTLEGVFSNKQAARYLQETVSIRYMWKAMQEGQIKEGSRSMKPNNATPVAFSDAAGIFRIPNWSFTPCGRSLAQLSQLEYM
jgi:hypothetical protein